MFNIFRRTKKNAKSCDENGYENGQAYLKDYKENIKMYIIADKYKLHNLTDEYIKAYKEFIYNLSTGNRLYTIAMRNKNVMSNNNYLNAVPDVIFKFNITDIYNKLTLLIRKIEGKTKKPEIKTLKSKNCKDDAYNRSIEDYYINASIDPENIRMHSKFYREQQEYYEQMNQMTPREYEAYRQQVILIKEAKNRLYQRYKFLFDLSKDVEKHLRFNAGKNSRFTLFSKKPKQESIDSLYKKLFQAIKDTINDYKDFENSLKCIKIKPPLYKCNPDEIPDEILEENTPYYNDEQNEELEYKEIDIDVKASIIREKLDIIRRELIVLDRKVLDVDDIKKITEYQVFIDSLPDEIVDILNSRKDLLIITIQTLLNGLQYKYKIQFNPYSYKRIKPHGTIRRDFGGRRTYKNKK